MTADELRQARAALRLSKAALGRALGVEGRTIRRWELGHAIPKPVDALVRLALKYASVRRELGIGRKRDERIRQGPAPAA